MYFSGDGQQQQATMPPLQLQNGQVPADWGQRVQVVQQQLQNQAYLQPIYGQQVLMPSNLIQQGFGQQPQIQVIASKPFQGGQITPQMLTTAQGKSVLSNGTGGFSGTYTLPSSSQPQTLLFSPVNVLGSQNQQQQQNILPMTTSNTQNNSAITSKPNQQEMSKTFTSQAQKIVQKSVNAAGQTIMAPSNGQQNQTIQGTSTLPAQLMSQIQQNGNQQMQFNAPWLQQSFPQILTTQGWPPQFQNSIFIRPDGSQVFIQNQGGAPTIQAQSQPTQQQQAQTQQTQQQTVSSQAQIQQAQQQAVSSQAQTVQIQSSPQQQTNPQPQQTNATPTTGTPAKQRLVTDAMNKQATPRTPTQILPQGANAAMRPNQASSVSTQTNQNQVLVGQNKAKLRKQPQAVRPAVQNVKNDAGTPTKLLTNGPTLQQIVTSAGNK